MKKYKNSYIDNAIEKYLNNEKNNHDDDFKDPTGDISIAQLFFQNKPPSIPQLKPPNKPPKNKRKRGAPSLFSNARNRLR